MSKANPKPPPNGKRIVSKDDIKAFFEHKNNTLKLQGIYIERCDGYADERIMCSTVYEIFRQIKVKGRQHVSRMIIAYLKKEDLVTDTKLGDNSMIVWEGNEEMKQLRALYEL